MNINQIIQNQIKTVQTQVKLRHDLPEGAEFKNQTPRFRQIIDPLIPSGPMSRLLIAGLGVGLIVALVT